MLIALAVLLLLLAIVLGVVVHPLFWLLVIVAVGLAFYLYSSRGSRRTSRL